MVDILGWVIDSIPSFIKSRICSKEELKQKHLADIKKEVFEPKLRILDETTFLYWKVRRRLLNIQRRTYGEKGLMLSNIAEN